MEKDTVGSSLELTLGAILIVLVFITGFYVVISARGGMNAEVNEENIESVKFDFGGDNRVSRGRVFIKNLDTRENLKVVIIENTLFSEFSHRFIFDMEKEMGQSSIRSDGEAVHFENWSFERYEENLVDMSDYLLENVLESSDFENSKFDEVPLLGRTWIYNFEIDPNFENRSFSF